jgi:hypothetical protein
MIYDLYVVSKRNGICIYHKGFGTARVNSDLVAGLLTAMFSFMKEVRGDDIRVIMSGTSKFVFNESTKLIFAVLVDAAHDEGNTSRFLEGVRNLFVDYDVDESPNSTINEDDPISTRVSELLCAPSKANDFMKSSNKTPIRLSERLTRLVASELTTQKDALTSLYDKIVEEKGVMRCDSELLTKYEEEIENLNRQIKETK